MVTEGLELQPLTLTVEGVFNMHCHCQFALCMHGWLFLYFKHLGIILRNGAFVEVHEVACERVLRL